MSNGVGGVSGAGGVQAGKGPEKPMKVKIGGEEIEIIGKPKITVQQTVVKGPKGEDIVKQNISFTYRPKGGTSISGDVQANAVLKGLGGKGGRDKDTDVSTGYASKNGEYTITIGSDKSPKAFEALREALPGDRYTVSYK